MFPLRLCGGKLLVAVTRERRYGPSRLRVNDDDDDLRIRVSGCCPIKIHSPCLLFFRFDDRFSAAIFFGFSRHLFLEEHLWIHRATLT